MVFQEDDLTLLCHALNGKEKECYYDPTKSPSHRILFTTHYYQRYKGYKITDFGGDISKCARQNFDLSNLQPK